ncbi:hypothetical protein [Duganella callida]|nr:hypothetical protein [Duganella callida]
MKLREWLAMAALGMLIGSAYAFMQQADEESAVRDRAVLVGKANK